MNVAPRCLFSRGAKLFVRKRTDRVLRLGGIKSRRIAVLLAANFTLNVTFTTGGGAIRWAGAPD